MSCRSDPSTSSTIAVRPATVADLPAVRMVHVRSIRETCAPLYTAVQIAAWTAILTPEMYLRVFEEGLLLVAEEAGGILGFGKLHCASGTVNAIYVTPERQGQGIGLRILQALETLAAESGVAVLRLNSTLNAESFYRAAGFLSDGPGENRLPSGTSLPCVSMHKPLVPSPPG